jgi:ATP-dependent Clp protease ATP-binding subunit ClpC
MFERFTQHARQVVVLAQEEARALKHNYIGTEHILLGLVREEEDLAARVLESLDITVEPVRAQVIRIVAAGDEVTPGQIPFTPRAKKVLELALREALSLGHNHIGTEHILLALTRENEGVAARILLDFDADSEKIRNEVIRTLSGRGRGRGPSVGVSGGSASASFSGSFSDSGSPARPGSMGSTRSSAPWRGRSAASSGASPTPGICCWRWPAHQTRFPAGLSANWASTWMRCGA